MNKIRLAALVGAGTWLVAGGMAQASVDLSAKGGIRHEDNLFRRPEGAVNSGVRSGSDTIFSAQALLAAQITPGNFNARLTLQAGKDWYRRNDALNNLNYSAGLAVARSGDLLQFSVNALSERRLSSFGDVDNLTGNIQKLQRVSADVTYPITPDIRVVVDPQYNQNVNSASNLRSIDYRQYGVGVGIGWFSPIGNSVVVTVSKTQTDGLHPRPVTVAPLTIVNSPIDFSDTSANLRLTYNPSVFTSIMAEVSYVRRKDQSVIGNDYRGPSGNVTLGYHPRSGLSVQLTAGRRLEAQSYIFVDSVRRDFAVLSGEVLIADRLMLSGSGGYSRRRFSYDPIFASTLQKRIDTTYSVEAALTYRLLERVELGAEVSHQWRDSSLSGRGFRATSYGVTARILFSNSGNLSFGRGSL